MPPVGGIVRALLYPPDLLYLPAQLYPYDSVACLLLRSSAARLLLYPLGEHYAQALVMRVSFF